MPEGRTQRLALPRINVPLTQGLPIRKSLQGVQDSLGFRALFEEFQKGHRNKDLKV